jgi:hypothetical protein
MLLESITLFVDRLLPVALISFFPLLVLDSVVVDRLVRLEYSFHRRSWEKDGKPLGPFFVPPQSRMFGGLWVSLKSRHALNKITVAWIFKTPQWVRDETPASRLLLLHRLLWSSLLLIIFGPFLVTMLL